MKTSRSLNKKLFLITLVILSLQIFSYAEEKPIDIWNIEKKDSETNQPTKELNTNETNEVSEDTVTEILKIQTEKLESSIEQENELISKKEKIVGLYDPEENDLDIDMWSNSDGDQLRNIFSKLSKIKLSEDASYIMKISMLTNSYIPKKNISEKEFVKFKSDWLIQNSDLELIEEYLIKNQILNLYPRLTKYLVDQYLSFSDIKKVCEIFSKNQEPIKDEYLSKYNIYCLINNGKKEEAQIIFDLKKEIGFKDKYFEKKISYLLGYSSNIDEELSEKTILDFHLAHITNPNFSYEPKKNTNDLIWKYLSSSNLLNSYQQLDTSELEKISVIEKATHDKNYEEKDLFEIYKRFQFNINQLLDVEKNFKSLSNIEGRALIYQKILLESELIEKLKLMKLLKNSFEKENLSNAFDKELVKFLEKINPTDVPDNLTSFYYTNINLKKDEDNKIKFNNDILHQSKLINYFNGDYSKSKIEKDVNNYLKKIKKDKKYFFSKKDQIFLESLKFDGIEISEKFNDFYEINESEIPTDIQVMINNNEKGAALLRIVEVIGQDELERIDEDTIYFIIRTLNQLNIDRIRNRILLKVLPLKV